MKEARNFSRQPAAEEATHHLTTATTTTFRELSTNKNLSWTNSSVLPIMHQKLSTNNYLENL